VSVVSSPPSHTFLQHFPLGWTKAPQGGEPLDGGASLLPRGGLAAMGQATGGGSAEAGSPLLASAPSPPPRAPEKDLLYIDMFVRPGVDIASLESQVRHVSLPHVSWPSSPFSFTTDEIFQTPGGDVKKLRVRLRAPPPVIHARSAPSAFAPLPNPPKQVCAIMTPEGDVRRVEEALKGLQVCVF
jgi:hypothetical protein